MAPTVPGPDEGDSRPSTVRRHVDALELRPIQMLRGDRVDDVEAPRAHSDARGMQAAQEHHENEHEDGLGDRPG